MFPTLKIRWTLAGLAALSLGTAAGAAEQVVLQDGRALRCASHRAAGPLVVLDLDGGTVTIPAAQIIRFENLPDAPAPEAGTARGAAPGAAAAAPAGGDPAEGSAATVPGAAEAPATPSADLPDDEQAALVLPPAPAPPLASAPPADETVPEMAKRIAEEFSVDPRLVEAVIHVESRGNPKALSPKGAGGLMQLMPGTADRFEVRDVFDPADNVRGGVRYLKWLIDRFDGDLAKVLAAYNAGEGAVDRHVGIPPYRETRHYVLAVLERYVEALRRSAAAG